MLAQKQFLFHSFFFCNTGSFFRLALFIVSRLERRYKKTFIIELRRNYCAFLIKSSIFCVSFEACISFFFRKKSKLIGPPKISTFSESMLLINWEREEYGLNPRNFGTNGKNIAIIWSHWLKLKNNGGNCNKTIGPNRLCLIQYGKPFG